MRILISIRALLVAVAMLAFSGACFAQVSVSVSFAPPELPVYEQPMCPGDGYIWTPGYWAWDDDAGDYYWVPGTWVLAPQVGYFWTPSWWGWNGSGFVFYQGYWAPVVGYYGGINYGYGYSGQGYEGGRWDHDHFYYNRSVNNVNVTEIHDVYNTTVVNNYNSPRPSFNGPNGVSASPTAQQQAAMHESHIPPIPAQTQHIQAARTNSQMRASVNRGKPPIAATPKPAAFTEHGVVPAKAGGNYKPPPPSANKAPTANTNSNPNVNSQPVHPNDLPPHPRPEAPSTGNQEQDQKYQQQQKLFEQQQAEHQELQKKQDQEHQKLAQQQQDAAKKQQAQQQMEQKHQQETQQMEQKHAQEQQQMKNPQQPHEAEPPPHQAPPPEHENPKKPPQ